MENVKKFYEALAKDKEMQERAQELNVTKPENREAAFDTIVAFAAKEGYAFSAADVKTFFEANRADGEIADEDLDKAAGGQDVSAAKFACVIVGAGDPEDDGSFCACVVIGGATQDFCLIMGDDNLCTLNGKPGDPGYECPHVATQKCTWG